MDGISVDSVDVCSLRRHSITCIFTGRGTIEDRLEENGVRSDELLRNWISLEFFEYIKVGGGDSKTSFSSSGKSAPYDRVYTHNKCVDGKRKVFGLLQAKSRQKFL